MHFSQGLKGLTTSRVAIIEKLPLVKNPTYLINFLRTGQVQNNFDCTVIPTYSTHKIFCLHHVGL